MSSEKPTQPRSEGERELMLVDVSQWKGTHYCRNCGYGIDPKDTGRECVVTDGDLCVPVRRTTTKKKPRKK